MSAYLLLQVELLVVLAAAALLARAPVPRRVASLALRGLLGLALLAPLLPALAGPWRPAPQVWAASTAGGGLRLEAMGVETLPALEASARVVHGTLGIGAVGLVVAILWSLLCVLSLRRRLSGTALVRRHRGFELRLGPPALGNFAVWLPGRSIVVLDEATFADPVDRRLALRHEMQHLRHGDAPFAWLLLALRAACAWNPAAHLLGESMRQLEELAVDEALVARGVSRRTYASCLLRAAERARPVPRLLAAGLHHPSTLKRRITMLSRPVAPRPSLAALVGAVATVLLLGLAQAADAVVTTSPLSTDRIVASLKAAQADDLPLPAHPLVAEALQKLTRSPRGVDWLRASVERQGDWAALVDLALAKAGLPAFLAGVPLIESGYENLGAGRSGHSAAPGTPGKGLWMFIVPTARTYGLRVDDSVDQRLDPAAETAAAVALLRDLHQEFGDWGLALAGYNQGAPHVRRAVAAEGTRDLWTLVQRGALNDYAPMVFAGALLLHEPELLER